MIGFMISDATTNAFIVNISLAIIVPSLFGDGDSISCIPEVLRTQIMLDILTNDVCVVLCVSYKYWLLFCFCEQEQEVRYKVDEVM